MKRLDNLKLSEEHVRELAEQAKGIAALIAIEEPYEPDEETFYAP